MPHVFVTVRDPLTQHIWVTAFFGAPGTLLSLYSFDQLILRLPAEGSTTKRVFGDAFPLLTALENAKKVVKTTSDEEDTVPVSLMLISFENRLRFRINGRASLRADGRGGAVGGGGKELSVMIKVAEAFGNCPKYIQRRVWKLNKVLMVGERGERRGERGKERRGRGRGDEAARRRRRRGGKEIEDSST